MLIQRYPWMMSRSSDHCPGNIGPSARPRTKEYNIDHNTYQVKQNYKLIYLGDTTKFVLHADLETQRRTSRLRFATCEENSLVLIARRRYSIAIGQTILLYTESRAEDFQFQQSLANLIHQAGIWKTGTKLAVLKWRKNHDWYARHILASLSSLAKRKLKSKSTVP